MKYIFSLLLISTMAWSQNLVLTNVSIIPAHTNTVLTNMNVYITNGVIDKIVSGGTKLPFKDYKTIDGKGKFLMPGMFDMHVHFPDKTNPISMQQYLKLNLAAGVTTLRSMRGEENQLALRDSIHKKMKVAPDIYVSYVFPETDSILTKDKIADLIFQAKIKKYDFIKYLGGLKPKNMNHLSQSCYEYKIPLAGHAYNKSLEESVDLDFVSIEHYQPVLAAYEKNAEAFPALMKKMKDKNVAVCPTLSFYYTYSFLQDETQLSAHNGMSVVASNVKEQWLKEYNEALTATKEQLKEEFESKYKSVYQKKFEVFNAVLKQIADENMLLLLSADEGPFNVPGFSMAEEMKLYSKAGLDNYQIIKAATYNAAVFLASDKNTGSVQEGKRANLILLNANPLENIENIQKVEGTILNGKYYSQKELLGISATK